MPRKQFLFCLGSLAIHCLHGTSLERMMFYKYKAPPRECIDDPRWVCHICRRNCACDHTALRQAADSDMIGPIETHEDTHGRIRGKMSSCIDESSPVKTQREIVIGLELEYCHKQRDRMSAVIHHSMYPEVIALSSLWIEIGN